MESKQDFKLRKILLALSLSTSTVRLFMLIFFNLITIKRIRTLSSFCCSSGLSLTVFLYSTAIYSLYWLTHSIGILWECVNYSANLTSVGASATVHLCHLQSVSLTLSTSGLLSVAFAQMVTDLFRNKWTKEVKKKIGIGIHLGVLFAASFAVTSASRPQEYGSLLKSDQMWSKKYILAVDLLICGVKLNWSPSLVCPVVLALTLVFLAWTISADGSIIDGNKKEHRTIETGQCCGSHERMLQRFGVTVSFLMGPWLACYQLFRIFLPDNYSLNAGLVLGQHVMITTAAIVIATCSTNAVTGSNVLSTQV